MNKKTNTKPCNYFTRLLFSQCLVFLRPKKFRIVVLTGFLSCFAIVSAQNTLEKQILAKDIETISINGNQIFTISVSTAKTDYITLKSTLDGEYQNDFQVATVLEHDILNLGLEHLSFSAIADDKRNAHKVIAATLVLEIPEGKTLHILSDVGSVYLDGKFKSVSIELTQGHCEVNGFAKTATISTMDGYISVTTTNATVSANSNNGNVTIDAFSKGISIWKLNSINGDITVAKSE